MKKKRYIPPGRTKGKQILCCVPENYYQSFIEYRNIHGLTNNGMMLLLIEKLKKEIK